MRVRGVLVLCAAGATAIALGGCGEDRNGERAGTQTAARAEGPPPAGQARGTPVAVVQVAESDYALDPRDARVERAGVVAFEVTNDGGVAHALEVEGPAGEAKTPVLDPGERSAIKVDLPRGTYKWYCPIGDHERRGMVGRVRVAE